MIFLLIALSQSDSAIWWTRWWPWTSWHIADLSCMALEQFLLDRIRLSIFSLNLRILPDLAFCNLLNCFWFTFFCLCLTRVIFFRLFCYLACLYIDVDYSFLNGWLVSNLQVLRFNSWRYLSDRGLYKIWCKWFLCFGHTI